MISAYYIFPIFIGLLSLGGFLSRYKFIQNIYLGSVLLIIFGGNRFNGADWLNYLAEYNRISEFSDISKVIFESNFEVIFTLFMWFFARLGADYEYFVFFIALLNVFCIIWLINSLNIKNAPFVLIIFILIDGWTLYHEQLRQSIAVTFTLMAVYFYINSYKKSAYLLIFLAMGFHTSAIFGFFALYISRLVLNNNGEALRITKVAFFVIITIVLGILFLYVVRSGVLGGLGFARLQDKVLFYGSDGVYGSSLFNAGLLAYILGFLGLMIVRPLVIGRPVLWLSISWTLALLWCFFGPFLRSISILIRFEHYMVVFFPFVIGVYFDASRYDFRRLLSSLYIFLFGTTFLIRILINPTHQVWVDNYQNIFLNQITGYKLDDVESRRLEICTQLDFVGNDFCR